ncbi:MAG TPA: zf-HC2 domain-containing protein [Steroidobacteraceae bacterium]|jgi:anti-sigma factor RsiW|nr:zf-HC2 domain-containing protein [Steroidobacteraceae bacterium]
MTLRGTAREHADVSALIPWYANETIGEDERRRVEAHIDGCEKCRRELAEQRRLREAMSSDTAVEYMPAASLNRLRARLDGIAAAEPENPAASRGRSGASRGWIAASHGWIAASHGRIAASHGRIRAISWQGLMAASVALMAVALSFLAADRFQTRAHAGADYYTVTSSAQRPPGEVIRAVFAPTATLAELQGMLGEAKLRIVAGPTEAGVYSLAQTDPRGSVSSSLALLRGHAKVRFAESTRPDPVPGVKPSGPSRDP